METIVKEPEPVIEEPKPEEVVTEPVASKPGEKTDPVLLLQSLREERAKIKELEAALVAKESIPDTGVAFSDEGKLLEAEIFKLKAAMASNEEKDRLNAVQFTYPAIKDKQQEFDDFRNAPENAGMRIETAAKAFLVENDLLEKTQPRKGLEKDTGGGRVTVKEGMTPEEIDDLRVNNYAEYSKRIRAGTLK